jgi:hypothetical protein
VTVSSSAHVEHYINIVYEIPEILEVRPLVKDSSKCYTLDQTIKQHVDVGAEEYDGVALLI